MPKATQEACAHELGRGTPTWRMRHVKPNNRTSGGPSRGTSAGPIFLRSLIGGAPRPADRWHRRGGAQALRARARAGSSECRRPSRHHPWCSVRTSGAGRSLRRRIACNRRESPRILGNLLHANDVALRVVVVRDDEDVERLGILAFLRLEDVDRHVDLAERHARGGGRVGGGGTSIVTAPDSSSSFGIGPRADIHCRPATKPAIPSTIEPEVSEAERADRLE